MLRFMSWSTHIFFKRNETYSRITAKQYSTKQLNSTNEEQNFAEHQSSCNNVVLDTSTIQLLERLALVNFGSEKSKEILHDAIKFANKIHLVNTDNVEPLINVLDSEHSTPLRDDVVQMENSRQDVMLNAKHVEEDYFVAPPSNVPLYQGEDKDVSKHVAEQEQI